MDNPETDAKAASNRQDGPVFQEIARFRGIIFDALLAPHDITMAQGWAVLHLTQQAGLRQADLAERLDIGTVTTSKLVDRLEARGFVERRPDPDDRRSNRLFATDKARKLLKTMSETQRQVDDIANAGINSAELETTLRVLGQMRQNLKDSIGRG